MIPAEHHVEVLAMNMWLGIFGERVIQPEWTEWANAHPADAAALREQAAEMIGVAHASAQSNAQQKTQNPKTKSTVHHSLGWLFG